jgi:Arc/MetJ-type ribon-helix-helix transcriptional regulator
MARKAAPTTEVVNPVDALPSVTISGAVPALISEAVEGYRWQNRMSRADVVKEALTEWADARTLLDEARTRLEELIAKDAATAAELAAAAAK